MSGSARGGQKVVVSPADELTGTGESQSRDAMNQIQDVCNSKMHS